MARRIGFQILRRTSQDTLLGAATLPPLSQPRKIGRQRQGPIEMRQGCIVSAAALSTVASIARAVTSFGSRFKASVSTTRESSSKPSSASVLARSVECSSVPDVVRAAQGLYRTVRDVRVRGSPPRFDLTDDLIGSIARECPGHRHVSVAGPPQDTDAPPRVAATSGSAGVVPSY